MKLKSFEIFPVRAGWRTWMLFKLSTSDGIDGWADCTEAHGSNKGLAAVLEDLAETIIGRDPMTLELIFEDLYRITRQSEGGLIGKALAAIENALLEIKARALGVPVYDLMGGKMRDSVPLYWSHCATTRLRNAEFLDGSDAVRTVEDAAAVACEARDRGFAGIKTNLLMFPEGERPYAVSQGFKGGEGSFDRNVDRNMIDGAVRLIEAMRVALGWDRELILDINMHLRVDGVVRLAEALRPFDLAWLEIDLDSPHQLAHVRGAVPIPIGSCEKRQYMSGFKPYFDFGALDVAIADVRWTGVYQAKKIADLAKLHDIQFAPHNHGSPLATLMSAHLCSSITNLRMMEYDVDDVPWREEILDEPIVIERGRLTVPDSPGWGAEIDENEVRRRAP